MCSYFVGLCIVEERKARQFSKKTLVWGDRIISIELIIVIIFWVL